MSLNDFALRWMPRSIPSRRVNALSKILSTLCVFAVVGCPHLLFAAETNAAPATNAVAETDTQMLRSFLLLQEQLRNTQRAVEQAREEAQAESRRTAEAMSARLSLVEQTLNAQRQKELESLQRSTRTVLIIIGVSTGVAFIGVIFAGMMQVRAATRLAQVSQQLQMALSPAHLALGAGTNLGGEHVETANANLLGAIDRLQHRLEEMEATAGGTHTATNGDRKSGVEGKRVD